MATEKNHPYQIGQNYFIRTVTMHHVGRLVAVYEHELVLEDASWIADDGRFHNALKGEGFDEIEPFIHEAIIGRHALIDCTLWPYELPKEQK